MTTSRMTWRRQLLLGLIASTVASLILLSSVINESLTLFQYQHSNDQNDYNRRVLTAGKDGIAIAIATPTPRWKNVDNAPNVQLGGRASHGTTIIHPRLLRVQQQQEAKSVDVPQENHMNENQDVTPDVSIPEDEYDPASPEGEGESDPLLLSSPSFLDNTEHVLVHIGHGGIKGDKDISYLAPVSEPHGVKCCSPEQISVDWTKKPKLTHPYRRRTCPYSYNFDPHKMDECTLKTYDQAREFCSSRGGRLCSAHELRERCAVGNGCDMDGEYVWTIEMRTVVQGNGGRDATLGENFLAPVDEAHGVKCCSREVEDDWGGGGGRGDSWSKSKDGKEWCPYSYSFPSVEDRCDLMTFRDAADFCFSKGGRICTAHELVNKCATANGCGFDLEFVWTDEYGTVHQGDGGIGERLGKKYDAPIDEAHGVKCCSPSNEDPPGPTWSKKPHGEDWCPYSYDFGELECSLVTFEEANEFCALKGGQLCTGDELANKCATRNGCDFDEEYVWTYNNDLVGGKGGSDAVATTMKATAKGHTLVHVFSPYHDPSAEIFGPLNHEQWTALVSIKHARDHYAEVHKPSFAFSSIVLVCAILETDVEVLNEILSSYCDRIVVLPRSTADEYPGRLDKSFPFVQDIIDAGKSVVDADEEEYHLMLTNSDICPTEIFYQYVELKSRSLILKTRPLIINRMTIPEASLNLPASTDGAFQIKHELALNVMEQAREAVNQNQWKKHPGFDCFVIHSSILKRFTFGDMFLGYPQWSSNFVMALKTMSSGRHIVVQSQNSGTYHMGDSRKWKSKGKVDKSFWKLYPRNELEAMKWCPITVEHPKNVYTLQNYINCGKLFQPLAEESVVPALVQPGYEEIYMNNYEGLKNVAVKYYQRKIGWLSTYAAR